jgi:hypothetical protein
MIYRRPEKFPAEIVGAADADAELGRNSKRSRAGNAGDGWCCKTTVASRQFITANLINPADYETEPKHD